MGRSNTGPSESSVQKKIIEYLEGRGGVVLKITANRYQHAGIPDLYYAEAGVQAWFEVKRPVDSYGVTPLQAKLHRDLVAQKVPVFVVCSVADVQDHLDQLGLEV